MGWKIDDSYEHQTAQRDCTTLFAFIWQNWDILIRNNERLLLEFYPLCLFLPADGRLAVRRPLGGTERLAHLSLCQAQGQPADLECFGKFTNLLQVDPVHLAGGGLWVYNTTHTSHLISPLLPRRFPHFSEWMEQTSRHMWSWSSPTT